MQGQITILPLEALHDSPFNPRRTFLEEGLQQLAADVKAHGIISPIKVRPMSSAQAAEACVNAGYQLVYGHRRLRAARLAGLVRVPCIVQELSDDEARVEAISENLSREDVHPIEEAEGFSALLDARRISADELAAELGKSRSYVYGRLKLLQACQQVRDACLRGEIGSEVALLVARLRTEKLQEKALQAIKGRYIDMEDGGARSYRQIRDLLNERFTLKLDGDALFDPADATLLPDAGACTSCPRRSGNAPEYSDVAAGKSDDDIHSVEVDDSDDAYEAARKAAGRWAWNAKVGADICTDPDCFDAKKKAQLKRQAAALAEKGKLVIDGAKARQAIDAQGNVKGAYIALKDVKAQLKQRPKKGGAAHDLVEPEVVVIQNPRDGTTVEAVKVEDLKAAGIKVPEPKRAASQGHDWKAEQRKRDEQRKRNEETAVVERQVRVALLERVRTAAAITARSAFDLQMVAQCAYAGVEYGDRPILAKLWGASSPTVLEKRIGQLSAEDVTTFLLDCALVASVHVDAYALSRQPERLLAAAKHYGVDAAAVRADVQTPAPAGSTPSPAARAPKKAAGAGAKKAAPAKGKAAAKKAAKKPKKQTDDAGSAGGSEAQGELLRETTEAA